MCLSSSSSSSSSSSKPLKKPRTRTRTKCSADFSSTPSKVRCVPKRTDSLLTLLIPAFGAQRQPEGGSHAGAFENRLQPEGLQAARAGPAAPEGSQSRHQQGPGRGDRSKGPGAAAEGANAYRQHRPFLE